MLPITHPNTTKSLLELSHIVSGNLCHRCGTCIGICPNNALNFNMEGFPCIENLAVCTDCKKCVKVCPGNSFNVQQHALKLFKEPPDINDMHGYFQDAGLAYATNTSIRHDGTSGGFITALLVSLLANKQIDGAIVVVSDDTDKWKGQAILAHTQEELLASTKSKYAIVPTNHILSQIRNESSHTDQKRYAVVGLPCQIHGIRKALELDKHLRNKIVLTIGLFCHAAFEHEPIQYIWDSIPTPKNNITRFISRIGKHPGTPHIELKDGSLIQVYFPNKKGFRPSSMEILNVLYRLYTPLRCLMCYDSTAEFADISVGDPWMKPPTDEIKFQDGYSLVLTRTDAGKKYLDSAIESNEIMLTTISQTTAKSSNIMMGKEKRSRAFYMLRSQQQKGRPMPDYGFTPPLHKSFRELLKTRINIATHILCFIKIGRKLILRLLFSQFGYSLLWLNNKRRLLRK